MKIVLTQIHRVVNPLLPLQLLKISHDFHSLVHQDPTFSPNIPNSQQTLKIFST